ncbi:MAG TPA: hypothetical protein VH116_06230 [Gemmatimonadales bacterium]|jgi:hypothetical protein|nr:hypothetical protein [Gemmatimonadales bacterium]
MTEPRTARGRETIVVVSIDTEEDNWRPSRNGVTVENIAELRRLARLLDRWGVRPTYLTAYQVAIRPRAVETLRECCAAGRAEIGAHLHPWNTPPLSEPLVPRNSMLKNLPAGLQLAKLEHLTTALEQAFDSRPRAFRAGRYGFGRDTVAALLRCGYRVDSSVSPFVNLERMDDGPNFVGAPLDAYRLAPDRDVRRPAPDGSLFEIPLSHGFTRKPFGVWDRVRRMFEARPWRWLHCAGVAARLGLVDRLELCPEVASVDGMLTLSRQLLDQGVRHLQLSWHSPTLLPGLSPFAATPADVERLYASIATYLEGLVRMTSVRFATMSEAAALLW